MSAVSKKKSDKKDKIILNIQRTLCYIVLIIISILCLFSFYVLLINTTRSHPDIQKGFSLIPGKSFFVNLTNLLKDKQLPVLKGMCNSLLVASGSEVATLVAGTELLRKDGIKVRIVSAPSEGLFRSQPKEYQESILPSEAKIFGLTAGLPVTLQGLVGCHGKVWGLESFGFSAPYKVLDEKLGFTAENVYNQVKAML